MRGIQEQERDKEMKKLIVLLILITILIVVPLFAQDIVRVFDRTGQEVNPGADNRWPVSHLSGAASTKMLLSSPGNNRSHYVTGFILTGGATADGFHILRQNCIVFDAVEILTLPDEGTDFNWDTKAANGDFSAEFWINLEATTLAVPLLLDCGDHTANGWRIELTAASLVKFTIDDGTDTAIITATTAIDDGEWHHIVCSVDRSETDGMQIYVDGVADATAVDPTGVGDAVNPGDDIVMTGAASVTFYISTIGIYQGSGAFLDASEVRTRYNSGIGMKYEGDESGLFVGYNTDEGIGTTCYDILNDDGNKITLAGSVAWSPSRQNGATAEVNEAGVPFNSRDMMRAVGKFWTGYGAAFGGVPITFPHPIKIGRNCPLSILETSGTFDLIMFGYTGPK